MWLLHFWFSYVLPLRSQLPWTWSALCSHTQVLFLTSRSWWPEPHSPTWDVHKCISPHSSLMVRLQCADGWLSPTMWLFPIVSLVVTYRKNIAFKKKEKISLSARLSDLTFCCRHNSDGIQWTASAHSRLLWRWWQSSTIHPLLPHVGHAICSHVKWQRRQSTLIPQG